MLRPLTVRTSSALLAITSYAAALALSALTSTFAWSAEGGPAPVDVLLKEQLEYRFSLSPNGDLLALVQQTPSGQFLIVRDTEDGAVKATIPVGHKPVGSLHWISPRRLLYEVSGKLIAVNSRGTDHQILLDYLDKDEVGQFVNVFKARKHFRVWTLVNPLWDDQEHILVKSWDLKGNPTVVEVNVFTAEKRILESEPKLKLTDWLVDRSGKVRRGVRFRKGKYELLSKSAAKQKWQLHAELPNPIERSLGFDGKTYLTKRVSFESFDYDERYLYLASNFDSDRFRIVKYDTLEGKVTEDVFADDRYDVGGTLSEVTALRFSDTEKALVGVKIQTDKPKTIWFSDRFKAFQEKVDAQWPTYTNEILQWSDDEKSLLIYSRSDTDPGLIALYRPTEGGIIVFVRFNDELEDFQLSPTEIVEFEARDGYALQGYLNMPAQQGETPVPLVVIPHGGPWARDTFEFDPYSQFFAANGIAVLRVNYRGSSGYGRMHLLAGVKSIDRLMIDDIADGAKWLIQDRNIDQSKVGVFGHSYGGYAALMSTIRYPDIYRAAVSWSAPLDMIKQLEHLKDSDNHFAYEFWKTAVGDPRKERDALKNLSPRYRLGELRVPILMFHGELDSIIPSEQAEKFSNDVKRKAKNIEVRIINDEGHSFTNTSNKIYILEKSLRFFESNLNMN